MRRRWLVASLLLLVGCKTDEPQPTRAAAGALSSAEIITDEFPKAAPAAAKAQPASPPPAAEPTEEAASEAVAGSSDGGDSDLRGYDRDGAVRCPPLPRGYECLAAQASGREQCERVGGRPLVCEDCSVLCSKPLAR